LVLFYFFFFFIFHPIYFCYFFLHFLHSVGFFYIISVVNFQFNFDFINSSL
jgi:hypothetical protein